MQSTVEIYNKMFLKNIHKSSHISSESNMSFTFPGDVCFWIPALPRPWMIECAVKPENWFTRLATHSWDSCHDTSYHNRRIYQGWVQRTVETYNKVFLKNIHKSSHISSKSNMCFTFPDQLYPVCILLGCIIVYTLTKLTFCRQLIQIHLLD